MFTQLYRKIIKSTETVWFPSLTCWRCWDLFIWWLNKKYGQSRHVQFTLWDKLLTRPVTPSETNTSFPLIYWSKNITTVQIYPAERPDIIIKLIHNSQLAAGDRSLFVIVTTRKCKSIVLKGKIIETYIFLNCLYDDKILNAGSSNYHNHSPRNNKEFQAETGAM